MKKLLKILKAALTKFSTINMVQYIGIATLILTAWADADLVTPSFLMLVTGAATVVLKFWQSTKEMVSTGWSAGWTVYLMGGLGFLIGFLDTFVPNVEIMSDLFGKYAKPVMMLYMALTIIFRTGFTNQSASSIQARKLST